MFAHTYIQSFIHIQSTMQHFQNQDIQSTMQHFQNQDIQAYSISFQINSGLPKTQVNFMVFIHYYWSSSYMSIDYFLYAL